MCEDVIFHFNLMLLYKKETIIHFLYLHWTGGRGTHSAGWLLEHPVHTNERFRAST